MSTFAELLPSFFADVFAMSPVLATWLGNHDHDGEWPDPSAGGTSARLAVVARWTEAFTALPESDLLPDESIDREIVVAELAAMRFADEVLAQEAWDPLAAVYVLGDGLHLLLAREFAPLAERMASAAARIEAIPGFLRAAAARLGSTPGQPVSRLHAETALRHLPGVAELCDEAAATAAAADDGGELATVRARLEPASSAAKAALDTFARHLDGVVLPASDGDGRLGPERYAAKLRHTLRVDLSPDALEERARREFGAVRAEMVRLARELWPTFRPAEAVPADESTLVRAVLDRLAEEHRASDELLDFCRAELARVEAFCRERSVIGLADEPLTIAWTPPFLRAYAGAMLMAPGPLDRGLRSYFYITPTPADWTAAQVESYLREDNDRMLRLLVIHEAVPGHYLQGVYANRCPSLVRTAFASGVFAEGWALYVTQVLMDLGYAAGDPGLMLTHWKFYLRAVTNALLDVGVHARGMTEAEALALMVDGGFQERSEAEKKYERARLSSTQLAEYFVGSIAMWDIEDEVRRRAAVTAGEPRGRAAIPTQRVVGAYGPTPGFDCRAHLEAVIGAGAPPIPSLRRILLGD